MADIGQQYSSAAHFNNENNNFEVQRTNHFEIVLDLKSIGINNGESEHLRLSTKSISTPKISSEAVQLKHGNDTIKVASAPTYDDLTLTVYDTLGIDQLKLVQSWFNRVFDPKERLMGKVSSYKVPTATLYMYPPDGGGARKWILYGIWPRSFGSSNDFSFDSTDVQTVTIELSVDYYKEVSFDENVEG